MADTTPTFVGIDRSAFPARKGRQRTIDPAVAAAILAAVQEHGAASDGNFYKTEQEARKVAQKMKRTLETAELPAGQIVRTQVGIPNGSKEFAFAVYLADAPKETKK